MNSCACAARAAAAGIAGAVGLEIDRAVAVVVLPVVAACRAVLAGIAEVAAARVIPVCEAVAIVIDAVAARAGCIGHVSGSAAVDRPAVAGSSVGDGRAQLRSFG